MITPELVRLYHLRPLFLLMMAGAVAALFYFRVRTGGHS
jgi:hypothetical protein